MDDAPTLPDLGRIGRRIGRYELGTEIGRGGMGVVSRAWDAELGREVALKQVRGEPSEESCEALLAEARAMASIRHPNVVTIHDVGRDGGLPYLVMELIDGRDLARMAIEDGPHLDVHVILPILEGVASGLEAIHARGRLHGDVKPSNVLLARDGRVVLTDMGVSRTFDGAPDGVVRGTAAYLPPERVFSDASRGPLSLREDVYSLGVMAFELMTGRLPFEHGNPLALAQMHASKAPPRASEVAAGRLPSRFDAPLARALAKDPVARTATPLQLVEELEAASHVDRSKRKAPARILVVDDDDDWTRVLAVALARHFRGAVVRTVSDGAEAVGIVAGFEPDIVLTDLNMPRCNGLELTAALRAAAPALPIVVMTGEGRGKDWVVLREIGADRFMVKPIVIEELCEIVSTLTAA